MAIKDHFEQKEQIEAVKYNPLESLYIEISRILSLSRSEYTSLKEYFNEAEFINNVSVSTYICNWFHRDVASNKEKINDAVHSFLKEIGS